MSQEELIKRLQSIRVWTQQDSTARNKLTELILQLGGR
jgi:hypothetical protein